MYQMIKKYMLKKRGAFAGLCLGLALCACEDETVNVGTQIMPQQDYVNTSLKNYTFHTHSAKTTRSLARANHAFLGAIIDPETGVRTTSGFLMQLYVPNQYSYPAKEDLLLDSAGHVVVDSCILRVASTSYFGDSLNTMKVRIQELDTANLMNEGEKYYSDFDPKTFVKAGGFDRSYSYAVLDQTQTQAQLFNTQNVRAMKFYLGQEFGARLLNKYYENPQYYANSYEFAKHVCAGFYLQHAGGLGTMIESETSVLDIYYRRRAKATSGKDSIVAERSRFASTAEVLQNTIVSNEFPMHLLDSAQNYTYLKTPAGLHTEAYLPIDEIVAGEHYKDTINGVAFKLVAAKSKTEGQLPLPEQVLMVSAMHYERFFASENLPDNKRSYLAEITLTSDSVTYAFNNVASLVSDLKNYRNVEAGVLESDTPDERQRKWRVWEQAHPDWNKVLFLAVKPNYLVTTVNNSQRLTLVALRNDFGLRNVKLVGGAKTALPLTVIYSRFAK